MVDGRAMVDSARAAADAVRPSRFPKRSVARPSLGGGHRSEAETLGPRELELPTFIQRMEA